MRVSIITPVLNGGRFIEETLASVRRQDHPEIEHIVVDGASTDRTLEILQGAAGVRWTSQPDSGMYDAINRGLDSATGDLIGCLNSDDVYATGGVVSFVVRLLAGHPEIDVAYGDYRFMDAEGRLMEVRRAPEFDSRALLLQNFIPSHSTFIRRRVLDDGSLRLDPSLRFAGDWDWVLRLASAGRTFHHIPRILSYFRRHPGSLTATAGWGLKLREWRRICRRWGISFGELLAHQLVVDPIRRSLAVRGLPD